MYYFAYGSNMSHRQMEERCKTGKFRFIGKAYLKGYRFVYEGYSPYRKGAVANIVKSENDIVWGGVFEIEESCLKRLDEYEGYPSVYDRKKLKVTCEGREFEAWVYLRKPQKEGNPSEDYRQIILEGAKDCDLPIDYVEKYLKAK